MIKKNNISKILQNLKKKKLNLNLRQISLSLFEISFLFENKKFPIRNYFSFFADTIERQRGECESTVNVGPITRHPGRASEAGSGIHKIGAESRCSLRSRESVHGGRDIG